MDESEQHIYCSGIDPSIVQLDYVVVNETENYKSWVKSNVYYNHTHDVRSILVADNQLISAGVDTKIVFKNIKDKQSHSSIHKNNSMPQVFFLFFEMMKFNSIKFNWFVNRKG